MITTTPPTSEQIEHLEAAGWIFHTVGHAWSHPSRGRWQQVMTTREALCYQEIAQLTKATTHPEA